MSLNTDAEALEIIELLLTGEIINKYDNLNKDDLPPRLRKILGAANCNTEIERPIVLSEAIVEKTLGITAAYEKVSKNPFVKYEDFGKRLGISALDAAAGWFL
ncbi:MAG: ATP-binding protein, partial [Methanomicrobium sp.]|nr:ATP-binding protein [Methanomicrobium sp.]